MRIIHLSNERRRDAEVGFENQPEETGIRTVLPDGEEKRIVKYLKASAEYEDQALELSIGTHDEIAQAIIDGDPEVDIESSGKELPRTRKVWVDDHNQIAYKLNIYQVIYNPDGTEKERRDVNKIPGNFNSETPLQWTGKLFKKSEIIRKFVFSRQYHIRHINGATFDFLFDMAKKLYESDSMVLVGAGQKGGDPLLLSRGGKPFRGFLEGKVSSQDKDCECYSLVLHLSDIELKGVENEA